MSVENAHPLLSYNEDWKKNYIHPYLLTKDLQLISTEFEKRGIGIDIHLIPFFTPFFCNDLIEYATNYPENKWGSQRHPDYPTYDVELNSIGLGVVYERFLIEYIYPLLEYIYNERIVDDKTGMPKVLSESFLIHYHPEKSSHLNCHVDSGEISLNISMNDEFNGGGTYFPKYKELIQPQTGWGVAHPAGFSHKHGAKNVLEGNRFQLVSFIHQSENHPLIRENINKEMQDKMEEKYNVKMS